MAKNTIEEIQRPISQTVSVKIEFISRDGSPHFGEGISREHLNSVIRVLLEMRDCFQGEEKDQKDRKVVYFNDIK